ncbi:MAG: NAD(P)/FAD-dependent oxidoreductase [Acidimicrobiales bacterium]
MHELAIVGLGLIGSAALRHAAAAVSTTGLESATVIGIGPAEPEVWSQHDGPFASHYDSGRVTRRLDARREWAILASRAIAQYPEIEKRSGIDFHRPSGLLFVRQDPAGIANLIDIADKLDIPVEVTASDEPFAPLPQLSFPLGFTRVAEPGPAGAIDPRKMIAAQHVAARSFGAEVERDIVISINPTSSGFELATRSGSIHHSKRVLVVAGAYSNQLLDEPLAMAVRPEVVAMGRIDEDQVEQLAAMPSIIYLLDHPELDDVYIVPPARYPDGDTYIKIGGSHRLATTFADTAMMNEWMQPGVADHHLAVLQQVLVDVLPEVAFTGWRTRPCLISDTASGLPYLDTVAEGLTVAVGGNGHAAKSADAIGALAADLSLTGQWNDVELSAADFSAQFGSYVPPDGSRHGN